MVRRLTITASLALLCACGRSNDTYVPNSGGMGGSQNGSGGESGSDGGSQGGSGQSGSSSSSGGSSGTSGTQGGAGGEVATGGSVGSGGIGVAGSGGTPGCDPSILLLLDRSASMGESQLPSSGAGGSPTQWDAALAALNQVLPETAVSISWGLKMFPADAPAACQLETVAAGLDVPFGPSAAVIEAINGQTATGNGTPTAQALDAAVTYLAENPSESPVFALLVTDGYPGCSCLSQSGTDCDYPDVAQTVTEQAISSATEAGLHTLVVGIGPSSSTLESLTQLSRLGGAQWSPNPLGSAFIANYHEELVPRLRAALARAITGCAGSNDACPSAGSVILDEDFEGPVAPPTWISEPNSEGWRIVADGDNHGYEPVSDSDNWLVGGHIGCANQTVDVKVRFATDLADLALLAFRVRDLDTFYFIELFNDGVEAKIKLRKRVGGATTDLNGATAITPFPVGTWHSVRASAVGSSITVSVDGSEVITASDAEIESGGIALGTSSLDIAFDDVLVTSQ